MHEKLQVVQRCHSRYSASELKWHMHTQRTPQTQNMHPYTVQVDFPFRRWTEFIVLFLIAFSIFGEWNEKNSHQTSFVCRSGNSTAPMCRTNVWQHKQVIFQLNGQNRRQDIRISLTIRRLSSSSWANSRLVFFFVLAVGELMVYSGWINQ